MISCMYIRSCIWVIGFLSLAGAVPWADPSLELLDELNDAEIYRAVVSSMDEWHKKHDLKRSTNRTKREDPSICYKELGCFEASGPFGYLDMLPSKPEEINTRFLMYPARTRRRRSGSAPAEVPFEKLNDAFEWAKSGFNKSLPTKVLIHGFGSDCGYIWAYEIRSALMAVEEVNTICVDWSNGASLPNYVKASANTRLVGKQLSLLLRGLVEKNGLSLRNTHLIGFSLGAHIAGFAGADLGNLSRITGLDPAGPLFESQDTRARLDETDASFVDVIHSNGENLILGGLGSSQPMGHVDFYPNGGRMQKGCSHLFVGAVSDIIWSSAVEGRSLCNHRRAYKFFIDSVSPRCHFPAFPCSSYDEFITGKCFPCTDERKCGNMGYYADRSKGRGQLYLITRDEEPFCAHQYLVKIESTPSSVPIKSYGKIQITLIGDSFLNETFMMTKKEDEEMKLGESISRILVPHPILSQPTRLEILYTAYSGWLSSGLTQWKLDKVTLMDSFGKVSSVCKKVVLESKKPVTLSLHPGECNSRKESSHPEAEDRMQEAENKYPGFSNYANDDNITKESGFKPTQVVRVGLNDNSKEYDSDSSRERPKNYKDDVDVFGIPWKSESENNVFDSDAESSRAFNTRLIKADKLNKNLADSDGLIREVVEPILKPHSTKNARSHDPDRDKPEITEPILGPTTARSSTTKENDEKIMQKNEMPEEDFSSRRQLYDDSNEWVSMEKTTEKWKRQDESKALGGFGPPYRTEEPPNNNPIDAIVNTVQFLPQRLARMFEQAEKYARETILPLVSTYTPRFISDFIGPRETPRYVPLHYDEDEIQHVSSSKRVRIRSEDQPRALNDDIEHSVESITEESVTTPYSHIQRITKKKPEPKIEYIFPTNQPPGSTEVLIQSTWTSTVASTSTESVGITITPSSKNTNTYTFNRANSHFSIEIDSPQPQNFRSIEKKSKRQDDSKSLQNIEVDTSSTNFRPLESLVNAIQSLPEGLTRFLTQAQNFTRTNILPMMENYSPRRLSDLIWIRQRPNVTMDIQREKSNNSQMQEEKVHINWSMESVEEPTTQNDSEEALSSTARPKLTPSTKENARTTHGLDSTRKLNNSLSFGDNNSDIQSGNNSGVRPFTENFSSVQNINSLLSLVTPKSVPIAELKPTEDKNASTTTLRPVETTTNKVLDASSVPIRTESEPSNITAFKTVQISTSEKPISSNEETTNVPYSLVPTNTKPELKKTEKAIRIVPTTTPTPIKLSTKSVLPSYTTPKIFSVVSPLNLLPKEKTAKLDARDKYVSKTDFTSVPLKNKYTHVQRIPKKGEKPQYNYPKPFTIVIDPNDLTTTPSTTSTAVPTTILPAPQKAFVSYIQKIPKKGRKSKNPTYKILRSHPLIRNVVVDNKVVTLKNQYGVDVTYRITGDGRFEI